MAMQIMMIIVVITQSLGITGNICSSIKKNGTTTHQRMEDILEVRIVSTFLLIVIIVEVKVVDLMLEMTSTSTTSTKKLKIIRLITMMAMQIMMIIVVMIQSLGITGNS